MRLRSARGQAPVDEGLEIVVSAPESASAPLPEHMQWSVVHVVFRAPEFGKDHETTCVWDWWVRFRSHVSATHTAVQARAREIVRAQYAPPVDHQESCDFCRKTLPDCEFFYEIKEDDFITVSEMPINMATSDDDHGAEHGPALTTAKCGRMKAARDAARLQKVQQEAEINALRIAHENELHALRARHSATLTV